MVFYTKRTLTHKTSITKNFSVEVQSLSFLAGGMDVFQEEIFSGEPLLAYS